MDLKLKFYSATDFDGNLKASIHASGKLGFSESAIKKLGIGSDMSALIAKNESETDSNLYMSIQSPAQEGAFKFNKAGDYYSLNTKSLFDNLGFDYRRNSIRFDIVQIEYEGTKIYKMIKKEALRKNEK